MLPSVLSRSHASVNRVTNAPAFSSFNMRSTSDCNTSGRFNSPAAAKANNDSSGIELHKKYDKRDAI